MTTTPSAPPLSESGNNHGHLFYQALGILLWLDDDALLEYHLRLPVFEGSVSAARQYIGHLRARAASTSLALTRILGLESDPASEG